MEWLPFAIAAVAVIAIVMIAGYVKAPPDTAYIISGFFAGAFTTGSAGAVGAAGFFSGRETEMGVSFKPGSWTNSRMGILAGRSIFAAVAMAASFFGWGASFRAVEKVLNSSAVMVRKKGSFFASRFSGRGGCTGGGGAGASAGGALRNWIWGRSGFLFRAPRTP